MSRSLPPSVWSCYCYGSIGPRAGTPQAAASFAIIADFVKEVGGESRGCILVPAGRSHSWEPTAKEARFFGRRTLY